jgi:hypothetical protein
MLNKAMVVKRTESRERRGCVASLNDVELIVVLFSTIATT